MCKVHLSPNRCFKSLNVHPNSMYINVCFDGTMASLQGCTCLWQALPFFPIPSTSLKTLEFLKLVTIFSFFILTLPPPKPVYQSPYFKGLKSNNEKFPLDHMMNMPKQILYPNTGLPFFCVSHLSHLYSEAVPCSLGKKNSTSLSFIHFLTLFLSSVYIIP